MKVLKFGGTSVATPDRIKGIGQLIKERSDAGEKLTIVFSAFGGVTDKLIEVAEAAASGDKGYLDLFGALEKRHHDACHDLLPPDDPCTKVIYENFKVFKDLLHGVFLVREASLRTMDYILSFGERNSANIIAAYFKSIGIPAAFLDARKIIKTNKDFGQAAVVQDQTDDLIQKYYEVEADKLHVVTGFIASDIGGLTTTLGRGGSDYTAALLAGALESEVLEIWTDVDGVLTSNPRIVKNAYTIPQLSYDEAMELSHFGAKVIYPPTIQPALNKSIPIYIKNTFNPSFGGTLISAKAEDEGKRKITGVTSITDMALLTLEGTGLMGTTGTAGRLFSSLGRDRINVIMITQASSEHSICIAVKEKDADAAEQCLNHEYAKELESQTVKPIRVEKELSLIAVIGEKMKRVPGVSGSLFKALGNNGINVMAIAQGSSELNISIAIKRKDEHKALNLVHDAFFLSAHKRLNLYLVGVGLIGGTLLKQIHEQKEALLQSKHLDIRINGIANSRKFIADENGIDLKDWQSSLDKSKQEMSLATFVNDIKTHNLANSIFIDCTANHAIKEHYPEVLGANVSIVTANKVAASDKYDNYRKLHDLALKHNVHFLYETNVGAGLPVLSTVEGLVKSGDKVEAIEAVISGSLSYIFNNYDPSKSFKELIVQAREKGYTEPDPRDDLSGQDIKRKIIILSRVAGYRIEDQDVHIEPILPASCMEAETIEDFFIELDKHDAHFRSMIEEAHTNDAKLRYVASLKDRKAAIKLEQVTLESPFYGLASTDNMIVIHTERYRERPLVIQGPGAGADVTAAGVFAEIIQLGNTIV